MSTITTQGELFEQVQRTQVLGTDGMLFVNATPRATDEEILKAFNQMREGDSLLDFVNRYFIINRQPEITEEIDRATVDSYIEGWLRTSIRQGRPGAEQVDTLIPLPHNYVVPGGRFTECYYWDSYFTSLGLATIDRFDLIQGLVDNFVYLQEGYGLIPNGNRDYYLSRSQPPVLVFMVDLLFEHWKKTEGDVEALNRLRRYLPALMREREYWMSGEKGVRLSDDVVLSRYYDTQDTPRPESYLQDVEAAAGLSEEDAKKLYRNIRSAAESGWDFSSRWMDESLELRSMCTTDIIPVDLNALLYALENKLAQYFTLLQDEERATLYEGYAEARKRGINQLLWDERSGFFHDYNFRSRQQTDVLSLATVVPLSVELATPDQAAKVVELVRSERLTTDKGLQTTATVTGQQWDAPLGWAPLQVLAVEGFRNYGYPDLACDTSSRWMRCIDGEFTRLKVVKEKYELTTPRAGAYGEYPMQFGFGWTVGSWQHFSQLYPESKPQPSTQRAAQLAQFGVHATRGAGGGGAGAGAVSPTLRRRHLG